VFQLTPPSSGGVWTESRALQLSDRSDGLTALPFGVISDASGNLYGVTGFDGDSIAGSVLLRKRLSPESADRLRRRLDANLAARLHLLPDGQLPLGRLVMTRGALFGTAEIGGSRNSYGLVFRIVP